MDGSYKSLEESLRTLNFFASFSGLKINLYKTKAVWIGCKKYNGETFNHRFKLEWESERFDLLGIKFSLDLSEMAKINFEPKFHQIMILLKRWSSRNFTPIGKIAVLKSLIISKLNYLFITIPNPELSFIDKLNKAFYNFIWDNKPDKVNREQLVQSYIDGGLK